MATGSVVKSDLLSINNYVQLTAVSYPKQLVIEQLREFFSQDTYYVYNRDQWGFPKVVDHTDLSPDAGIADNSTTRIYIGEAFRYDVIFYPAILVKNSGIKAVPISFNREKESVQWKTQLFIDGYGNESIQSIPSSIVHAGAFEGQISIEINTRSLRSRDELTDLVMILFIDKIQTEMENSGVFIKPNGINAGSPSETDDRNDKLLKQVVTIDYRSEWKRQIPVENTIDIINICVEFGHNILSQTPSIAPNLSISTDLELIKKLQNM